MVAAANTEVVPIPGKYTVADAAGMLGVSKAWIIQLIHSGALSAQRTAGGAFLIDAQMLHSYQQMRMGRGRPWRTDTAWAALWMLSGMATGWLSYHQLRRLRQRLASVSPEGLVWLARKRATVVRLRASGSFLQAVKADIALSGKSAATALSLGLTERNDVVEGYAKAEDLSDLMGRHHLTRSDENNLILHMVEGAPIDLTTISQMPEAVALVDLGTSTDTRERSAALRRLGEIIDGQG
jgi:excisionase family DNA binding protein